MLAACADKPVQGSVDVQTRLGGAFRVAPLDCADGRDLGFWGVHLRDGNGRALDIYERGGTPYISLYAPGVGATTIASSSCDVFEGELERTEVWGRGTMEGVFTLDCRDSLGNGVVGELSFRDCGSYEDDYRDHHYDDSW